MPAPEAAAADSPAEPVVAPDAVDREPAVDHPRRALATVVAVVAVDLVGFGVVIPILPFYVRSFGVSDAVIGLLAASYSLAQFAAAPALGRLSDARGRRPVIVLSLVGGGVAWTVFGLAGESGAAFGTGAALATLFASRTLAGAMGGNVAAAQAYVADVTPVERRAGALGLVGAAFGVGFVVGPALGGLLASDAAVAAADGLLPAAAPATPYSVPSFGAAALSLSAAGLAVAFLPEPRRVRRATPGGPTAAFRRALATPAVRPLVVAFFVYSLSFSGVQVMFVPYAADAFGYDAAATALLLSYVGALGVVNQGVLVGRLSRRVSSERLAAAGALLLGVALAALTVAPGAAVLDPVGAGLGVAWLTGPLVALLSVLAGLSLANATVNVGLATLVSTRSPAAEQGGAFGVTQGAASLGRTVGPPVMAGLYVLDPTGPFLVGAALAVPVAYLLRRGPERA